MDETEKQMMLHELDELCWFMKDTAGKMDFENKTLWDQITDLDQESGDYCEVTAEIFFNDGRYIELHNRSFESLINNSYSGDEIRLQRMENAQLLDSLLDMGVNQGDVFLTAVNLRYDDPETGSTRTCFPISSVVRISHSFKKVKWSEKWRMLSPDKVRLHETIFRNLREKYLSKQAEKKE